MTKNYQVPAENSQAEIEVKKSRFIARAARVNNREEAMAMVEQAKKDYPDARHVCWAYLIGNPFAACTAAMNDAGEPSGTAGKPILNVIQHKKIGDIVVVVIRYFGGIKLGAGGLTRAYAGATENVLADLPLAEMRSKITARVECDFSREQAVRHWADQHEAEVGEVEYTEQVVISLQVFEEDVDALQAFCEANGIGCRFEI